MKTTSRQLSCFLPMLAAVASSGLLAAAMPSAALAADQTFTPAEILAWGEKTFEGQTAYRVVEREGRPALEARAQGQASARYLEEDISLEETPYLKWCWQVDSIYPGVNEKTKGGDDYPARLYVVNKTGILPWQVEAINYVWSSNEAKDSHWDNAFTDRAVLLAVESGDQKVGQWVAEVRDLRADYSALFGSTPDEIAGLALMADGDNAGGDATALFRGLSLSSDTTPPSCGA
ncbi:DUF3047 domain-containing protein [Cobetia sp. 14N.309.X.WAT.E.A4]|uniref:DUF3047 domain-containing protein n=1 Tax=Cobetia sp. 14N.309.X.WAT.E.A4 TaxID=2998323 RepID=UPI0025B005A0|nr:DUF3047 domain-containing protein [Cobetia sp. 14N.309.X.WAT.E.A4]MDN2656883.1 DUF3047 domain-containing protein [Cobetia sp. 14N.309.X.WAT.E.A4]